MGDKIKTSIVIDRKLWEEFRSRVGSERGLKMLSRAVEEAIEEEVGETLIINALSEMLEAEEGLPLVVSPVKPKVPTNAGKVIRGMREART